MNKGELGVLIQHLESADRAVYAGIDPGMTGAIAFVHQSRAFLFDIPTIKTKKARGNRSEYDLPGIADVFLKLRPYRDKILFAIEEAQIQVKGRGSTAYGAFQVGIGFGCLLGMMAGMSFRFERVHPITWKTRMGLIRKDKEDSRLMARGLFPKAWLDRVKDHNRAEALLLAEYLKRKVEGTK